MNRYILKKTTAIFTFSLLLACATQVALADPKDDEIADLKAQVARLKKQLEQVRLGAAASKTVISPAGPQSTQHQIATQNEVKAAVQGVGRIKSKLHVSEAQSTKQRDELAGEMLKEAPETGASSGASMKLMLIHRNVLPTGPDDSIYPFSTGSLLGLMEGSQKLNGGSRQGYSQSFYSLLSGLRLRESLDNLKPFQMTVASDVIKAPGSYPDSVFAVEHNDAQDKDSDFATFNYTYDRLTHASGWKAKGVLYLPMTLINSEGKPASFFNYLPIGDSSWCIFYPAVRFDRDSSKDNSATPENSLDFLLGADFNFYEHDDAKGPNTRAVSEIDKEVIDLAGLTNFSYVVHAEVGAHTDFSFHRVKPLYALTYTPVLGGALNTYASKKGEGDCVDQPFFLWKPIFKTTGLLTQNVNDTKDAQAGQDTMPLGYSVGFGIKPSCRWGDFWEKAELKAEYDGNWDVQHNNTYHGLFTATLNLPTVGSQTTQSGWSIIYRRGDDPTSHANVNEVAVALRIKF